MADIAAQGFKIAFDKAKRVIDFVCHAGRHQAQGCHFFTLKKL